MTLGSELGGFTMALFEKFGIEIDEVSVAVAFCLASIAIGLYTYI